MIGLDWEGRFVYIVGSDEESRDVSIYCQLRVKAAALTTQLRALPRLEGLHYLETIFVYGISKPCGLRPNRVDTRI